MNRKLVYGLMTACAVLSFCWTASSAGEVTIEVLNPLGEILPPPTLACTRNAQDV